MTAVFHVDAFVTNAPFSGNPAAVCVLDGLKGPNQLQTSWMQGVALGMNLSETAFVGRREDGDWDLRWFTPAVEVDLCGHATLATAHALWTESIAEGPLTFHTRSGALHVDRDGDRVRLDFPATPPETTDDFPELFEALGVRGALHRKTKFDFLVETTLPEVRDASPDFSKLRQLDARGIIVTAAGEDCDFVSRFFAPAAGVDEDPVTGSAHCALAPFWAERLKKRTMRAQQLSPRGGELDVAVNGDRVLLLGKARTTLRGELVI